jgi:Ca2+-binding EF-hand superfamily protein
LRHANSAEDLKREDIEEFLRIVSENSKIKLRIDERRLFARKIMCEREQLSITAKSFLSYVTSEIDKLDWVITSNRLRLCANKAELEGFDVEQMLSDRDKFGNDLISLREFRDYLTQLSQFGRLTSNDIELCCRMFSRESADKTGNLTISPAEFLNVIGMHYIGNVQAKVRRLLSTEGSHIEPKYLLRLLNDGRNEETKDVYTYQEVTNLFKSLGILQEFSSIQFQGIWKKLDKSSQKAVTLNDLFEFLGINAYRPSEITAEVLLQKLLQVAQTNGTAIDQAFRHFDCNGDGQISATEFVKGLQKLEIFSGIDGWEQQIPLLVQKFDIDGDEMISLKEFFVYLGIKDYIPNIIQRLTKVFAIATLKGLSFSAIFKELDTDKNGFLDVPELLEGLRKIGSFEEVSESDVQSMIQLFSSSDGNSILNLTREPTGIAIEEFINFFSDRVQQILTDRNNAQFVKVCKRFRDIMNTVVQKGASLKKIFDHLDQDNGGSVSISELTTALMKMENFMSLSTSEIKNLLNAIDSDKNGEITLDEFEDFVNGDNRKIRSLFEIIIRNGAFESLFQSIQSDSRGRVSIPLLARYMLRDPNFHSITYENLQKFFDSIDSKRTGCITSDEVYEFFSISKKSLGNNRSTVYTNHQSDVLSNDESMQDRFRRHLKRISIVDGSIRALLAYLDDDEDGFLSKSSFFGLLRKEDVFSTVPECVVDEIMKPFVLNGMISCSKLLFFLEGHQMHNAAVADDDVEPILKESEEIDYSFSNIPEILSVQRKLRQFGRIISNKGVDVEEEFRRFDIQNTGQVSRTDFIRVLSSLGLFLIEKGKIFSNQNEEINFRRRQLNQIINVKQTERPELFLGPNYSRRIRSGPEASDFKVCLLYKCS